MAGEEQRVLVLAHEVVDLLELGMVGVAVGVMLGDEGVLGVRVGVGELGGEPGLLLGVPRVVGDDEEDGQARCWW